MLRLVPAALLLLTFAACRSDTPDEAGPHERAADTLATSPTREMMDRGEYSDARFFREMTAHHRMALDMAGMAQTMATNAEIKAMAAKMQSDQQREIAEMTGLLRGMGEEVDTTAAMGAGHEGMMGMPMTMDELRTAQPFDRAFLVSMIGHHSSAITMASEAQAKSTNTDVLRMARNITTAQADEIGRMQRMLETMGPASTGAPVDTAAAR